MSRRKILNCLEQLCKLFLREVSDLLLISRPVETTVFKPFVQHDKSVAFPKQCFKAVSTSPAEQEQAVRKQIELELLTYDSRKTVDGFSHIRMSAHDVYVCGCQIFQHCLSPLSRARIVFSDMFSGSSISRPSFRIIILPLPDPEAFSATILLASVTSAEILTGTML